jgi:hypothetical protein
LDTGWCLDRHHVLDLMRLHLPTWLLDLNGQLQPYLLGNSASLLLCLGLDLSLDLGRNMRWEGREELDRLLETRNRDQLMPDRGLDLKLRLGLKLRLDLKLGLSLELVWSLDLGLCLELGLVRCLELDLQFGL